MRKYSQASYPEVKYLIDNPDVLANVGFDEDGWPEWPNGFAPDTDIFRDEGEKVSGASPKVASNLSSKVTAALRDSGVPIRTRDGVTEVLVTPATENPVREKVRKVLESDK